MNINAILYFAAAQKLGLDAKEVEEIYGFVLKLWRRRLYFFGSNIPFNNVSSMMMSRNKFCFNKTLEAAGLPVPKTIRISREEFQKKTWDLGGLRFPLVIKPTIGTSCGQDVLCNIQDIESLKFYLRKKFENSRYPYISLEEFYDNLSDYRVLVFRNKVIGVTKRIPAQVIGDGKHSILELIELENCKRDEYSSFVSLGDIKIDDELKIRMRELGITPDYIPKTEEVVRLCYNCNSTRGGAMISLGEKIHKENAKLFCKAAKVLGLNLVGFDVRCEDINIPIEKSKGVIIESNCCPDISIHEQPMEGIPNRVSYKILKSFVRNHFCWYIVTTLSKRVKKFFASDFDC